MKEKLLQKLQLCNQTIIELILDVVVIFDKYDEIDLKMKPQICEILHFMYKKILFQYSIIQELDSEIKKTYQPDYSNKLK